MIGRGVRFSAGPADPYEKSIDKHKIKQFYKQLLLA